MNKLVHSFLLLKIITTSIEGMLILKFKVEKIISEIWKENQIIK